LVDEWLAPTVGLVGVVIGVVIGDAIRYFLSMREKSVTREFEMYQKGMEYLRSLYGFVSVLFDLVDGYVRAKEKGTAQISDTKGFIVLKPYEIVEKYRLQYKHFTQFLGEEKGKGSEVFLRRELANDLTDFWALAGYFYEKGDCDGDFCNRFDSIAVKTMGRIENLLGVRRQRKTPQWLRVSKWREIIKGE
jgi:hypothetical protein